MPNGAPTTVVLNLPYRSSQTTHNVILNLIQDLARQSLSNQAQANTASAEIPPFRSAAVGK